MISKKNECEPIPRLLTATASCIVIAAVAALGTRCASTHSGSEAGAERVELTGTFDPYECHDEDDPDAVVLKPRPDCGSCHARGTVYRDEQGLPRLELSVSYPSGEGEPWEWDLAGKREPEGLVFTKPKFRLVYARGEIRGDFRGKMNADIRLSPKPDERQDAPREQKGELNE